MCFNLRFCFLIISFSMALEIDRLRLILNLMTTLSMPYKFRKAESYKQGLRERS